MNLLYVQGSTSARRKSRSGNAGCQRDKVVCASLKTVSINTRTAHTTHHTTKQHTHHTTHILHTLRHTRHRAPPKNPRTSSKPPLLRSTTPTHHSTTPPGDKTTTAPPPEQRRYTETLIHPPNDSLGTQYHGTTIPKIRTAHKHKSSRHPTSPRTISSMSMISSTGTRKR